MPEHACEPTRRRLLRALTAGAAVCAGPPALALAGEARTECERHIAQAGEQDPAIGERLSAPLRHAYDGFTRPALAIELASPFVDFHIGFMRGPTCFPQSFVRPFVHELLHFWQALSQGFITNLALQEYLALEQYRRSGRTPAAQALLERFQAKPDGAPFSPYELSESLCRYWDLHILGPERVLAEREGRPAAARATIRPYQSTDFDALVRAMTEDAYAEAYRWALHHWGTLSSVLLFPLVGYFALQSPRPVEVFLDAAEKLKPLAGRLSGSIHENWRRIFADVRRACGQSALRVGGSLLTPGWDVIRRGRLMELPLWRHHLALLEIYSRLEKKPLDFCFALPGDPEARGSLATALWPAVTLFRDGRWIALSPLAKLALTEGRGEIVHPARVADEAQQLARDYRDMREAVRLQSFGLSTP